jgi:histidyl-tRNA synthetase
MNLRAPRGTRDLLPADLVLVERVEGAARTLFPLYGYREIRPPLFEETALFVRSIGEATDVVEKEMFTVVREDASYTFRPEGTAGVARAYLEHQLHKERPMRKLFYVGPMFRYERPQKGRERQFDQVGIEAIGSLDPYLDAEAIHLAALFFEQLGLEGVEVRMSSMGDGADRDAYREKLRAFVEPRLDRYCATCRARAERNLFRVLDCREPGCRALNAQAPALLDSLSKENREHFDAVRCALDVLRRAAIVDPSIARGFDYYTRTVFELHLPSLGARSALCGGGRYDHLLETLGGPPLGAVGFAIGVTPTLLALAEKGKPQPSREVDVFVACVDEASRPAALRLAEDLRSAGVSCDLDHEGRSVKGQMRGANRLGALAVVVLGPEEIARGMAKLKLLESGAEAEIRLDDPSGTVAQLRARR